MIQNPFYTFKCCCCFCEKKKKKGRKLEAVILHLHDNNSNNTTQPPLSDHVHNLPVLMATTCASLSCRRFLAAGVAFPENHFLL